MPRRGVIYLVSGPRSYMSELQTSLASLRRHEPDLPVTVFSRHRLPRGTRADHASYSTEHHPLKEKVLILSESPYERTLFLDTDTTILGPISPVFDHLDSHQFGVANAYLADRTRQPPTLTALVDPAQYNTGVLLYDDSAATRRFLDVWRDAVMPQDPSDMWAGHNCDQTYFNRLVASGALAECGVEFSSLPNTIWNVRGLMVGEMKRLGMWSEARVLHHRTRGMKVRKLVFSATDAATLAALARNVTAKIRRRIAHRDRSSAGVPGQPQ
jgi:hypothetical protein